MREESRRNWISNSTTQEINAGSLQRIADATEVMAKSYQKLIDERDMYKRWYEEERGTSKRLYHSNRALRGVITKIKKG